MDNGDLEITESDQKLIEKYHELAAGVNSRIVKNDDGSDNYSLIFGEIKSELLSIDPDINHLVDVLVKYTFDVRKSKRKTIIWVCFGEEIYQNICRNLPTNTVMCECCGKRVPRESAHQIRCAECSKKFNKKWCAEYRQRKKKAKEDSLTVFEKTLETA